MWMFACVLEDRWIVSTLSVVIFDGDERVPRRHRESFHVGFDVVCICSNLLVLEWIVCVAIPP